MGGPGQTPASRDLQAPGRAGVRLLSCFSWAGRRKRHSKGAPSPPACPVCPAQGASCSPSHTRPTPSTSSETEVLPSRAFFSGKARVSFRHQLDSTATIDSTG